MMLHQQTYFKKMIANIEIKDCSLAYSLLLKRFSIQFKMDTTNVDISDNYMIVVKLLFFTNTYFKLFYAIEIIARFIAKLQ